MAFGFDEIKDKSNRKKHGLSLALAESFDWLNEPIQPARTTAGEARFKILARQAGRVLAAIFTVRGEDIRVISLRPASRQERRTYAERKARRA